VASAILVVVVMAALYHFFHGYAVPDWDGYNTLYGEGGAWLLKEGRDPVFLWLLRGMRVIFGAGGYNDFRAALFVFFTTMVAIVAFLAPPQRALGRLTALGVALILIEPFLLKGLAQIREGLAFLAVLAAVASMFAFQRRGFVRSGMAAVLATAIHFGTGLFAAIWVIAASQTALGTRVLSRGFQHLLCVTGLTAGLGIALLMLGHDQTLRLALRDYGVNTSAEAIGGLWKYAYWFLNGALVLVIRRQLIFAAGARQFGFLYATTIGSFAMPLLYALCFTLVFTDFHIPAITSMIIRLLFTTMELSLVVVVFRGRANLITVGVAAVMAVDRLRLLLS